MPSNLPACNLQRMNSIHLQQTLPQVFADRNSVISDVWHQDLFFHKGKSYLIEAASGTGKSSLCSYKDKQILKISRFYKTAFVMIIIFFGHVINEKEEKMQEKICLTF